MKILITGADGFLGSHLTEKLIDLGHKVTALSYYNSFGFNGWLHEINENKNLNIIHGDIRDENFINKATKGHQIIFHLAAQPLVSISYLQTNVIGTSNILTAAKRNNIKRYTLHQLVRFMEVHSTFRLMKSFPINLAHPMLQVK